VPNPYIPRLCSTPEYLNKWMKVTESGGLERWEGRPQSLRILADSTEFMNSVPSAPQTRKLTETQDSLSPRYIPRTIAGVFCPFSGPGRLLTTLPASDSRIRVLVADTAAMSCHLLADALRHRPDYLATAAAIPKRALQRLEQTRFDVVLIGVGAYEDPVTSTSFIRQVQRLYPLLSIIVLIETRQPAIIVEALRCGARGIFCRSDSFEDLCKCIRCVHAGQVWASSADLQFAIDALFEHQARASRTAGTRPLSRREEQITVLVAEGYSNRQISERLGLSEHTIKNYLFRIFEKIGVSTRVGLTLYMLKQGPSSRTGLPSLQQFPVPGPVLLPNRRSNSPNRRSGAS
jgi:DNA-binding NarL/FixJ family response regulator